MQASETQVGGDHYKNMVIQPAEFIHRNSIGFLAGNVIKYVCRYKSKAGRQDLEKARHFLDLLIEKEYGGVPVADDPPMKCDPNEIIQPSIGETIPLTSDQLIAYVRQLHQPESKTETKFDKSVKCEWVGTAGDALSQKLDSAQAKAALGKQP